VWREDGTGRDLVKTEYTIQVWLKGAEDEKSTVTIHVEPPLGAMDVKAHCCKTALFSFADYQRIRYKRVKARCVRCRRFRNPAKDCLFYNLGGYRCKHEK